MCANHYLNEHVGGGGVTRTVSGRQLSTKMQKSMAAVVQAERLISHLPFATGAYYTGILNYYRAQHGLSGVPEKFGPREIGLALPSPLLIGDNSPESSEAERLLMEVEEPCVFVQIRDFEGRMPTLILHPFGHYSGLEEIQKYCEGR